MEDVTLELDECVSESGSEPVTENCSEVEDVTLKLDECVSESGPETIIENGSEYVILLDRSTDLSERYTLGLRNGNLHKTGDSFIIGLKRFTVIYSSDSLKRITIKKSK